MIYSEPVLNGTQKKTKNDFQDLLSLNSGQKYCRMLQESNLQYFRPSLSYHWSSGPLLCLFLVAVLNRFYQSWDFAMCMPLQNFNVN